MKKREIQFHKDFEAIFKTEKAPVEKVAEGYKFIILRILTDSEREMEILQALGDKTNLVKEQIKHSTIEHALDVFGECYLRATGELLEAGEKRRVGGNE